MKKKLSAKTLFIISAIAGTLSITGILEGFIISSITLICLISGFFAIKKPWGKKVAIGLIIVLGIFLLLAGLLPFIEVMNS